MSQIPPDPELKALESALGELVPVSSRLDRDKLMFQAGAMSKSAARRRWGWPAIAAALSLALAGESVFIGTRPAPHVVERIVFVPAPAGASASAARQEPGAPVITEAVVEQPRPSGIADGHFVVPKQITVGSLEVASDYQRFQNLVVRFGLDAFPERPAFVSREENGGVSSGSANRSAGTLRSLELERILKPGDPS
jgi:hypothetical protein